MLKDATPYSVMFDGTQAVFLDLSSFRHRDPLDAVWQPYAQFIRTFVYPLLASRFFGLRPDELLLANRDGLEPGRMLTLCPLFRRLVPPFLGAVTIPALLERGGREVARNHRCRPASDAEEAALVLDRLFTRARRLWTGIGLRPARRSITGMALAAIRRRSSPKRSALLRKPSTDGPHASCWTSAATPGTSA